MQHATTPAAPTAPTPAAPPAGSPLRRRLDRPARKRHGRGWRGALAMGAVMAAATLSACASPRLHVPADLEDGPPGGRVLTRSEIQASGARDAMEALERGGTHLQIQRTGRGRLRMTHRGVDSFLIQPDVLVVVDGARISHAESTLRGIPAESIQFIQVLSGREAAMQYGRQSGNGVVVVRTSAR